MRRILISLCLSFGLAAPAIAQDSDLVSLETGASNRGWEGVGRLDIDGEGFCTAAMIGERLILTAAHCLYDDNGRLIDPGRFTFHAGLRAGRAEASRTISRLVAHPAYSPGVDDDAANVAMDIAVMELETGIRRVRIQPFPVAARPTAGEEIGVVSYGRGRANTASLQEVCAVIGRQEGVLAMTCEADFGTSGAPVFRINDGTAEIVSVVSAVAELDGAQVSLGTSLADPLQELLAHFAEVGPALPGGTQAFQSSTTRNDTGARVISPGNRTNTGAKFVRP